MAGDSEWARKQRGEARGNDAALRIHPQAQEMRASVSMQLFERVREAGNCGNLWQIVQFEAPSRLHDTAGWGSGAKRRNPPLYIKPFGEKLRSSTFHSSYRSGGSPSG